MKMVKIKKKTLKIFVFMILIVIILSSIPLVLYLQYKKATKIERQAFVLISQGKYVEGLQGCLKKPYQVASCYAFTFASMLAKNENITQEFCKSISLEDRLPFWNSKEKQKTYYDKVKELKTQCYQVYFTKTLGINDVSQAQNFATKNSNL